MLEFIITFIVVIDLASYAMIPRIDKKIWMLIPPLGLIYLIFK